MLNMSNTHHDLETLSGRIAYAIEESGVSRQQIATACNISPQAVGLWINGPTKNLRNEHLFVLAEVTGYHAKWIATGKGQQKPSQHKNTRIAHVLKVMESLPPYALDEAVKSVDTIAQLVRRAEEDARSGGGKVSNGN